MKPPKPKSDDQIPFKVGDKVAIKASDEICRRRLVGTVESVDKWIAVSYRNPPLWFKRRERSRGLFYGDDLVRSLSLFPDHNGTWTALQDMKQYNVAGQP